MKKFLLVAGALALVLALGLSGAWAYDYPNNTMVKGSDGIWYDVIGYKHIFETYGVDISGSTLTIFTNWGPENPGYLGAYTADLFLDVGNADGVWDYAVKLNDVLVKNSTGGIANIVSIPQTGTIPDGQTGVTYSSPGSGGTYGQWYGTDANLKRVPVIATGTDVGDASVVWSQNDATIETSDPVDTTPDWTIAINLGAIPGLDAGFFALWGTGTCSNDLAIADVAAGVVPIPGALVLLGAGLVRLAAYGRKRRAL